MARLLLGLERELMRLKIRLGLFRNGFQRRMLLLCQKISRAIVPLMVELFTFIRDFEGDVPGASAKDCGNYLDMNLPMAKYLANKHLNEVLYGIADDRLVYPE